ncbi:AAA family ATPase [Sphingomonas sanguinis]|uniref:AAA family ATPase n=1 Tax=Sphingomonas sanguinis TaxID=33051 RepID=UPI00187C79D9|nr:AAA family ATPase [Sphingomonas sanguinis]
MNSFTLSEDNRKQFLSLPTVRFLQGLLNNPKSDYRPRTADVADFLEREILQGTVKQEDAPAEIVYRPDNLEEALPMHAVSSMVSELAPILVLLRSGSVDGTLILEEPESHLHIHAQRVMARAVARLVNRGVRVVLTTHSDTFLQQVNILIQIEHSSDRDRLLAEMGYEEDDLLSYRDVQVVEFCPKNDGTHVVSAICKEGGFVINSINETLAEMANEVIEVGDAAS